MTLKCNVLCPKLFLAKVSLKPVSVLPSPVNGATHFVAVSEFFQLDTMHSISDNSTIMHWVTVCQVSIAEDETQASRNQVVILVPASPRKPTEVNPESGLASARSTSFAT